MASDAAGTGDADEAGEADGEAAVPAQDAVPAEAEGATDADADAGTDATGEGDDGAGDADAGAVADGLAEADGDGVMLPQEATNVTATSAARIRDRWRMASMGGSCHARPRGPVAGECSFLNRSASRL